MDYKKYAECSKGRKECGSFISPLFVDPMRVWNSRKNALFGASCSVLCMLPDSRVFAHAVCGAVISVQVRAELLDESNSCSSRWRTSSMSSPVFSVLPGFAVSEGALLHAHILHHFAVAQRSVLGRVETISSRITRDAQIYAQDAAPRTLHSRP